ncbi:hypothetical protein [Pleionea sediminis]|uniref:hypothetical protein n=1 Tax=Pleionea sediminis TaxID=2569479 RepID=UPI0011869176|nr:hypothetical protein [Pleionea sediminis]
MKDKMLLKDAILGASYHKGDDKCKWYDDLPSHLKDHEIGKLIYAALYKNDKRALDKAATLLTGDKKNAWLGLEKM